MLQRLLSLLHLQSFPILLPVANPDTAITNEDSPVTIDVLTNDSDDDGDTLTVVAVVNPPNGTVSINLDNTLTYTPAAGFVGEDIFAYTIDDGTDTAMSTVTVTVNAVFVNTPPIAEDDTATVPEDSSIIIPVLDNDSDVDGDPLTVSVTTNAVFGTTTVNVDNTITYTPNADYDGTDSFVYMLDDGNGGTDTALVSITITSDGIDETDTDGDGVPDDTDTCPNTAPGAPVDGSGCADNQRDSDNDNVTDDVDVCPGFDDNVQTAMVTVSRMVVIQ